MEKSSSTIRELRSFGVTVGAVVCGIGLWPAMWSGAHPRWWALAIGGLLLVAGLVAPRMLVTVHRTWMAVGHVMGWINTRIILTLFFYLILTPMGLLARLFGKDFMRVKTPSGVGTYRVARAARSAKHVWHQF
jgi:Saxitoxin biosynthesis operon protein SxtJ